MAFVTSPVKRRVFANLLGVFWFNKRISTVFIVAGMFVLRFHVLLFVYVSAVSVIFYQQTYDLFVTVACCPQKRIPAILLSIWISLLQEQLFGHLVVTCFDCIHEGSFHHFGRHLFPIFFVVRVVVVNHNFKLI